MTALAMPLAIGVWEGLAAAVAAVAAGIGATQALEAAGRESAAVPTSAPTAVQRCPHAARAAELEAGISQLEKERQTFADGVEQMDRKLKLMDHAGGDRVAGDVPGTEQDRRSIAATRDHGRRRVSEIDRELERKRRELATLKPKPVALAPTRPAGPTSASTRPAPEPAGAPPPSATTPAAPAPARPLGSVAPRPPSAGVRRAPPRAAAKPDVASKATAKPKPSPFGDDAQTTDGERTQLGRDVSKELPDPSGGS